MKKNKQKGITLVALVITIIILLILAGISISALTNQGLFGRANDAKRESEIASIKEQIALDIYEKQLEPPVGSITEEQLKTILEKHGTIIYEEDGVTIKGITTAKGYEILLKDIYGGETVAESVPDGAIVNPVNDITTWLKTGEISKQYSYTTIEQVIADTTCTESLMNNENAMKYLARSTEFADAICESETTMTYLGQSAYVDDTVLNSDYWVEKCKQSPYWKQVAKTTVIYDDFALSDLDTSKWVKITNGTPTFGISNGSLNMAGSVKNIAGISSSYTLTGKEKYVELEYCVSSEGGTYKENNHFFMQNFSNEGFGNGYGIVVNGTLENPTYSFMVSTYNGSSDGLRQYYYPPNSTSCTITYLLKQLTAPYKMKFVYEDGTVTLYVNDTQVTQFPVDMQYIIGQPVFKIMTGNYDGSNKSAYISLDYIKLTINEI